MSWNNYILRKVAGAFYDVHSIPKKISNFGHTSSKAAILHFMILVLLSKHLVIDFGFAF